MHNPLHFFANKRVALVVGMILVLVIALIVTLATPKPAARVANYGAPTTISVGFSGGKALGLMAPAADSGFVQTESISAIMPPVPGPTAGATAAEVDQRIIKNGYLSLVVDDVGGAATKISDLAGRRGGFVQSSSVSERADGTHAGNIDIRVPAKEFESAMAEIKTYAKLVKNEQATGQDVTEQYTDLEAQLHNAQAQEKTYLDVLTRAKTVEDILKVQQQLGIIRGQIESLQGRIKYLENVTSYSTINVSLEEEPVVRAPTKEFRPLAAAKEAVQSLVEAGQGLLIFLIWAFILVGGFGLPIALIVVIVWAIARRRRNRPTPPGLRG